MKKIKFSRVIIGEQFFCENGGHWRKISDIDARCVETDSGYEAGDVVPFFPNEKVTPDVTDSIMTNPDGEK